MHVRPPSEPSVGIGTARPGALLVAVSFLLVPIVAGCVSSGLFPAAHLTDVRLDESDFGMVASGVTGRASADYVLGLSGGFFGEARTVAVARVGGAEFLYGAALEDLWANFESEYGPVDDRALALANVRFDADALNLVLFTRSTISIRADVVEFR